MIKIDLEVDIELRTRIQFIWHFFPFGLRLISLKGLLSLCFLKFGQAKNSKLFRKVQFTFKQSPSCIDYRFDGAAKLLNHLKPIVLLIFNSLFVYPEYITMENF